MSSALSVDHKSELTELANGSIDFDFSMARRTTLRIGGPADALFAPTSIEDMQRVVRYCSERELPMLAVGGGSNLLVRDSGIRGVVIATRKLRGLERRGDTGVYVEAGVSTGKLLSCATDWCLGGVEFLGGVPGSVGGGMIMNAGTYLGEFKDVTTGVRSMRLTDGEIVDRDNAACGFSYRNSVLPKDEVVVSAELELSPRNQEEIQADVAGLRARRKEREPHKVSNSGSTFKNPPGDYAGRLIEVAGLKGTRVGGAECSPKHANWLVNTGDATAADMIELIDIVRGKVHEQHGITLELEVKIIGEA